MGVWFDYASRWKGFASRLIIGKWKSTTFFFSSLLSWWTNKVICLTFYESRLSNPFKNFSVEGITPYYAKFWAWMKEESCVRQLTVSVKLKLFNFFNMDARKKNSVLSRLRMKAICLMRHLMKRHRDKQKCLCIWKKLMTKSFKKFYEWF